MTVVMSAGVYAVNQKLVHFLMGFPEKTRARALGALVTCAAKEPELFTLEELSDISSIMAAFSAARHQHLFQ